MYIESLPVQSFDEVRERSPRHEISTVLIRALAEVAQQRGVSPEQLLGERADQLYGEPTERGFAGAYFQQLFARAVELTGDPAIALHCGLQASEASFGLMSPLVAYAQSLRHGLELVAQFHPLLLDGFDVQLSERTGVARLRCVFPQDERYLAELAVAGLARMLQAFGCARSELIAVCFEHTRPAYYYAYNTAFGGTERFSQPYTGIEFAAEVLDRPHLHRSYELHQVVLTHAERRLKRCWRAPTVTERVNALLQRSTSLPDMIEAARMLGLSVRSLRRHLEDEGTSYRELTQTRLYSSACVLLRNPKCSLQSIAHELGFADASAFHRAFRRWAAMTPAMYRMQASG